jgi:hypothetical protein
MFRNRPYANRGRPGCKGRRGVWCTHTSTGRVAGWEGVMVPLTIVNHPKAVFSRLNSGGCKARKL